MKNNKAAYFLPILLALSSVLTLQVSAGGRGWYCMRKKSHERPYRDECFSYIDGRSCAYIGKKEAGKVLYLTFDAGYSNDNVIKILDTLKAHNARASFFILEGILRSNPEAVSRMADDGHLVCNHTSRHRDMTRLSFEEFEKELSSLESSALEKGITVSSYYRPPEGKLSPENLDYAEKLGYKTVLWSLAYADWDNNKQPGAGYATDLLLSNTHDGAVILLHPTSQTNAMILDSLMTEWEKLGYRFGTVDELF